MKAAALPAIVLALCLCQCGTPSAPKCHVVPRASRGEPSRFIEQARQGWRGMATADTPAERGQARLAYNTAVARLFDQLHCGGGTLHDQAAAMGTGIDESRTLGAGIRLQDLDAILPASRISTDPIGVRHAENGLGVPVVGWKKTAEEGEPRWEFEPPTGVPLNLTAVLRFPDNQPPQWAFVYPGRAKSEKVGGRDEKLAADWSAPSALYWQMSDLDDFDLAKVFLPSRFTDETALYVSSPYDPKRIPLVMVHGLKSSPGAFKKIYNELNREPWFRENYQVWFFSYPTGNNWTYSAARFRVAMTAADKFAREKGPTDRWEKMVVIGHSMGGVITQASLKKPGDRIIKAFDDRPLELLTDNEDTRRALRLLTMYEPLQPPDRAIFLAAPHRGSPMADRFFSEWAVNLIRLPKTLTVDLVDLTLSDFSSVMTKGETSSKGWFTSIGSLSPSYPAYEALDGVPFREGVKIHSVIGDRGKGNSPESSDGVVPYWSSHLEKVESEKIVPYHHGVPDCPVAAGEVKRILKEHLGGSGR
jgi:pimeloyl-ACP methyl ester carboxylesterase